MLKQSKVRVAIILSVFLVVGWFLFTYRILDVPPGINGDEAIIGYNGALVARNGYDSNGKFLPLFTSAAGTKDWKQPVTFYSEVLAFHLFGPSYFTLRAVSVFFVLLSGAAIFLLTYELLGLKGAVWSLFIFATTPIVMIQSHLALENIAPVPFVAFWLWAMIKYSRGFRVRYLVLAAIVLALSIYSYLGLKLIIPSFMALTFVFIYHLNKRSYKRTLRQILIFFLIVIPFLLSLLLVKREYPGSFFGQYRPYKIASYQQLLLPYISTFDPSFLFIQGDVTPYHSTGKQGMFLLASLPLFVFGLVNILQRKQPISIFVLTAFFLTPLLYGLASDIHRGSRLLTLIPPYVVISSLGAVVVLGLKNKYWRYISLFTLILLIVFNFTDFLNDYWFDYPNRVRSEFAKPYQLAFEKAYVLAKQNNLTPFIQSDLRSQNPIAIDFFRQAYFADRMKLWQDNQPMPADSVVIVSDYILSKRKEVNQIKMGDNGFGLLINQTKE